jgi:hypothetical protein
VVGHVSRTDQNRINLIEFARHRFLLHHFHLAFDYGALDTQHGESGQRSAVRRRLQVNRRPRWFSSATIYCRGRTAPDGVFTRCE